MNTMEYFFADSGVQSTVQNYGANLKRHVTRMGCKRRPENWTAYKPNEKGSL